MSSTHRKQIARRFAEQSGLTYQQALTALRSASAAGSLPHTFDAAGMDAAVARLLDLHAGGDGTAGSASEDRWTELGFSAGDVEKVQAAFRRGRGLLLFVGPDGSGKTSALSAVVQAWHEEAVAADARRAPVVPSPECGVKHRMVGDDVVDSAGVAATMRQLFAVRPSGLVYDPCAGPETAANAVEEASRALSFATVRAADAAEAVRVLCEWYDVEPAELASVLSCVVELAREEGGPEVFSSRVVLVDQDLAAVIGRGPGRDELVAAFERTPN